MAKKRLNKTLVVVLSLCAFVAMIVLSALMLQGLAQRDPKYFVDLAQKAAAQQDWQQAAVFYNQAYERSRDPNHLVEFGEMMLREGDVRTARAAWIKALVQDPTLVEGHVRQLNLLLRQARLYGAPPDWEAVREAAKAMLDAIPSSDQSALAHHALGLALMQLRERGASTDEGLAELRKAAELKPEEVSYPLDLAEELVRRDEMDQAQNLYEDLIAKHTQPGPSASKVRTAYAQYLAFVEKKDEAEAMFQQGVTLAGDDVASRRDARLGYAGFLAQSWLKARRAASEQAASLFDAAEKIIQESIQDDPKAFDAYVQLANLYRLAGLSEKVVEVSETRIRLGLDRKGIEATQNRLSAFTLMTYASEASVSLAVRAASQQDFAARDEWLKKADQFVADARGEAPNHPMVLSQSGRVKIAKGQERAGLEDLHASDEAYKAYGKINWDNRLIRARVHLQLNEAGAAKTVLEEVLTEAASTRASDTTFWNLYAQTLVQVGDLERAMNVVDRTLALAPANKDAKRIKAAIFERQGKPSEAARWNPDEEESGTVRAILEARAATMEGDSDKALQLLEKALETEPANPRIVATLASELAQAGKLDQARAVVAKAQAADPENDTFNALALTLRAELTPEDRERELLKLIEAEDDAFKRSVSLVAFYSRKNDPAKTLEAVNQAFQHADVGDTPAAKTATSMQLAALLRTKMRAAAALKNDDAMAKVRDDAARLNVDGAGGKTILGLYHYLRREFDLAAQAFQAALDEQPTHVPTWVMLGQCLQALGNTDESREAFNKALEINPSDGSAHQGLAVLAHLAGDQATFQRELAKCEKLIPDDPWVREQVLLAQEAANPKEAIERREKQLAAKEEPGNLQRLADLYASTGQKERADEAYERLLKLNPGDIRSANAAAVYFRKTGRGERAVEILRQAMTAAGADQQAVAATTVAGEQLVQGDSAGAEKTLLEAVAKKPSLEVAYALGNLYATQLNQPAKAVPWFDQAVELASQANSPSLPMILERRLALLLDREVNDLARAREEAADFRRRFPENSRGYLIQSEVQARSGEIEQAISSLADYLLKRPNDVYALTQRAQHLIAQGRLPGAIADLERIKQTASAAVATPARILLSRIHEREGRMDRAIAELELLSNETPGSSEVEKELISAYMRQKRYADAERIVTGLINRGADKPDAAWLFLRGQIFMEQKDPAKALADFRRGADAAGQSPAALSLVLGAYLRLGEFDKGVQYYEGLGSREEKDSEVLGKYADLLAKANQPEKAVDVFRNAMAAAIAASSQHVQILMGLVLDAFPAAEAIAHFEKVPAAAALARPNDRLLARLYAAANRTADAQAKLDSLLQSANADAEKGALLYEKGEIYQVAADRANAVSAYRESLKFVPDNWYTLNNLAYILSEQRGNQEEALQYARKAVAKADNPFTLDTLGWILVHMGKFDAAVAELSRAIRQDSDYALSYYHLGEAYRRGGRFDEAAQVLESGLQAAKAQQQAELVTSIEAAISKAKARDSAE